MWQDGPSLILPDGMYFYIQSTGGSPLMVACEFGHSEVAGILIARGAVVNFQNKVRQSCMISIITVVLKNSMVIGM